MSDASDPSVLISNSLTLVTVRPLSHIWDVITDGKNFHGEIEFQLIHRESNGALMISIVETKQEDTPPSHDAFWMKYAEGKKQIATLFEEVPLPDGFVAPLGFSSNAAEWSISPTPEPAYNTDILCGALHGDRHVSIGIGLPYEDRASLLRALNAALKTIEWV
jgi:hypothetical protein